MLGMVFGKKLCVLGTKHGREGLVALEPSALGHWVTSEALGPEPTKPDITGSDITGHELEGMSEKALVRQPMPSFVM